MYNSLDTFNGKLKTIKENFSEMKNKEKKERNKK